MIYYFSGTGNSKWIAEEMARLTHDQTVDITAIEPSHHSMPLEDECVGIVFPVYAWAPPEKVVQWCQKLARDIGQSQYVYSVCTYGGEAGDAMGCLAKALKPLKLHSTFGVLMPNNYMIGWELETPEEVKALIENAKTQLQGIADKINDRQSCHEVSRGKMPVIKTALANYGFNKYGRTTKPFTVASTCNSCGRCAKECPTHTIQMNEGRPVWGSYCFQCLRCINRCPKTAIDYGKKTIGRRRYTFPSY